MAGRRQTGRRGRTGLSPDDEKLWNAYAKQVKPFEGGKQVAKRPERPPKATDSRETIAPAGRKPAKPPEVDQSPKKSKVQRKEVQSQPTEIHSRQVRRIKSGRETIDARIDLHGMRQRQAHEALRRFLFAASAKGHQTVLVITGKGGAPSPDAPWVEETGGQRGVLKRMVPLWLAGPELGALVVSYATAHVRHGGEGALYVRVRRGRRGKTS